MMGFINFLTMTVFRATGMCPIKNARRETMIGDRSKEFIQHCS
jgi:hypothetical protein